jgi:ferredoxin-fold anticodon binding domain-containing protein
MNESLRELIGKKVQVTSLNASAPQKDVGILESFDHPWVKIRKGNGQVVCFAVYNVRLIELV